MKDISKLEINSVLSENAQITTWFDFVPAIKKPAGDAESPAVFGCLCANKASIRFCCYMRETSSISFPQEK